MQRHECFEFVNIWSVMKHAETSGIKSKKKHIPTYSINLVVNDRNLVLVANS
jgi:hypothetical protein